MHETLVLFRAESAADEQPTSLTSSDDMVSTVDAVLSKTRDDVYRVLKETLIPALAQLKRAMTSDVEALHVSLRTDLARLQASIDAATTSGAVIDALQERVGLLERTASPSAILSSSRLSAPPAPIDPIVVPRRLFDAESAVVPSPVQQQMDETLLEAAARVAGSGAATSSQQQTQMVLTSSAVRTLVSPAFASPTTGTSGLRSASAIMSPQGLLAGSPIRSFLTPSHVAMLTMLSFVTPRIPAAAPAAAEPTADHADQPLN